MAHNHELTTAAVFIMHRAADSLISASIVWPLEQPKDTYTIDATSFVSVELDKHLPIRPARLAVHDGQLGESCAVVERLFGKELARAVAAAPSVGMCAMQFAMEAPYSIELARLQGGSPSTPPLLREACAAKLAHLVQGHPDTPHAA